MLPSLLIWDFNGTLLDDGWLTLEINNIMNRDRGLPEISPEYYGDHFDHPPMAFYEKLGYDFEKEPYVDLSREFLARYDARHLETALTPHVTDALQWAKEQNIPQIVISAHNQQSLTEHLELLGILPYFQLVSGEDSLVITGKVQRAKTLAESGAFDFSNAVLIGDTTHDFDTAQAIGCRCVLYTGGHQTPRRLASTGAPVISNMEHLIPLLEQ